MQTLAQIERTVITKAVRETDSLSAAAELLGLNSQGLRSRMYRLGLMHRTRGLKCRRPMCPDCVQGHHCKNSKDCRCVCGDVSAS